VLHAKPLGVLAVVMACLVCGSAAAYGQDAGAMKEGAQFRLGEQSVTIKRWDVLPYVEDEYSKRFQFDRFDNPKLWELRETYQLDEVVAPGKTEFEKQVLLMHWVNRQWMHDDPGPDDMQRLRDANQILKLAREEHPFNCVQYGATLAETANSLGWVARVLGNSGHTWTEVWSNQYGKWVMLEPTSREIGRAKYIARDGIPLNTYEIVQCQMSAEGMKGVESVTGPQAEKAAMAFREGKVMYPVFSYIPNTNLMDSAPDYGNRIVTTVKEGVEKSGLRTKCPATDPYFPVNQAALELVPSSQGLNVKIRTLTPNFATFRVRLDGAMWADRAAEFKWSLHPGENTLEAKSVNQFGVEGPVSTVTLTVDGEAFGQDATGDKPTVRKEIVIPAVSFQAEDGGKVKKRKPTGGYIHKWFRPGHWVEWEVDIAAPGEYEVALNCIAQYDCRRALLVNGQAPAGLSAFTVPATGPWELKEFKEVLLPGRVSLAKGRNTLRLACLNHVSLRLNAIRLKPAGGTPVVVEAVDRILQGGGEVGEILPTPEGYLEGWKTKGHWLEWTVEGAPAGEYAVYLRYASINEMAREMRVNGTVVPGLESFNLPSSGLGSSDYWKETRLPARVTLKDGKNVIRLTSLEDHKWKSINLARIRLVPVAN